METFCKDMMKMGTLRGFLHFSCYLRGREELLVTIPRYAPPEQPHYFDQEVQGNSTAAAIPALDGVELYSSSPMQTRVSPDVKGMPPASPAQSPGEGDGGNANNNVFLIGGYTRYKSPFVWLRSGTLEGYSDVSKDVPLKLKTMTDWQQHKAAVWMVISELVTVSCRPRPRNPLAVNLAYLEEMPVVHSALATAALMNCLLNAKGHTPPTQELLVLADLQRMAHMHFSCLGTAADLLAEQHADDAEHVPDDNKKWRPPKVGEEARAGSFTLHRGDSSCLTRS
mmetsp:Transcript_13379/g.31339  ORF Transcript_13379/g.31339 Transcript_13379/m.31339 type:complete len:282 (-) Transcript_13379:217-1062(-)